MRNGFLLINKEQGMVSFKLVSAIRQKANQKAVGFAGTLDPLASGLMVMALGEYTKLLPYLEASDKVYEAVFRLDGVSDTGDADGVITKLNPNALVRPSFDLLNKIVEQQFTGELLQVPPRHSAVQIGGRRAYDMARRGEVFEMEARRVRIFSIEILRYQFPELELRVHCSSGTYIRSLALDLGKALGVGGYVVKLVRTKIGQISLDQAVKLDDITAENLDKHLKNGLELFPSLPKLEISDDEYAVLARGNFIDLRKEWLGMGGSVMLALLGGKIVGVLEFCENGRKLKFKKKFNL